MFIFSAGIISSVGVPHMFAAVAAGGSPVFINPDVNNANKSANIKAVKTKTDIS
jgi:hypothetical protein